MEKIIFNSQYFNILDTLDCGQVFRFSPFGKGFIVLSKDKCAYLYHQQENAVIECKKEDIDYFYNYFDLERDYKSIYDGAINEKVDILTRSAMALSLGSPFSVMLGIIPFLFKSLMYL